MTMTVWKATFDGRQSVEVPIGSKFLHAREQHGGIAVWFWCDPTQPMETRELAVVGTGGSAPDPDEGSYLGTALLSNGHAVFHVFELRRVAAKVTQTLLLEGSPTE